MKQVLVFLSAAAAGALLLSTAIELPVPEMGSGAGKVSDMAPPEAVTLRPGFLTYRLPGEYLAGGRPVDAPQASVAFRHGLEMMRYQVSVADYKRCAAEGACRPADAPAGNDSLPVTGVDYRDAVNYAAWLSEQTGERWRLPTDAEWAFAAAERFVDDGSEMMEDDEGNPAARWLARYRREAGNAALDPMPKPYGYFGRNSKELDDMAGNIWDWTSTCYTRATIEGEGAPGRVVENCGVRVAGGRHRAYMSFFIRDGKSGGCAAGMAPHNLGIRLVREQPSFLARLKTMLQRIG